jgi:hypothetical protein
MSENNIETGTVFIIPCSATKLGEAAPARDLYTSVYFRQALAAAESQADRVLILSAKHGLLELDEVVAPYELRMGDPGSVGAETLAAQAVALGLDGADIYGMLPSSYFQPLWEALSSIDTWVSPVYEGTGGIGDQKHVAAVLLAA